MRCKLSMQAQFPMNVPGVSGTLEVLPKVLQ